MATDDLQQLKVYQLAMRVGEGVWALTAGWEWLVKQTVALPWIRAADSIATNISKGYGHYASNENVRFFYHALGSIRETQTWLEKARARRLIIEPAANELALKLETLRRHLDLYINSLDLDQTDTIREGTTDLLPLEEFFHPRPPAWNN